MVKDIIFQKSTQWFNEINQMTDKQAICLSLSIKRAYTYTTVQNFKATSGNFFNWS